jgi:RNA 2',3'-cyclic 3'-phosphodiesterase
VAKERLKSPRARLFVALDLPQDVRAGLVAWQQTALADPALRVVRPEALHMTLVFLGYQAEKQAKAIAKAAFDVNAEAPAVELAAEPVGVPSGKRPRLIALAANSEETVALQAQVEAKLVAAGFYEPEKRPFWPHLTMARVKPEAPGSRKPALIRTQPHPLPEHMFRFFRPTRLVLFKSHLRRTGAEYEAIAELELPDRQR